MPLLQIQSMTFAYDEAPPVLQDINLSMTAGQSVLIVGDNGSGKTTMGLLLAGLLRPTSGRLLIAGESPHELHTKDRCQLVSYMGQVSHLSVLTSSIENEIDSFCQEKTKFTAEIDYKKWAKQHSLPTDTSINPRDLTTPDLWRLILGLYVVILQPKLLVIDEVFCPGNEKQQECVRDVLERRKQKGMFTIFLYQRLLPFQFDAIGTIKSGKLLFSQ